MHGISRGWRSIASGAAALSLWAAPAWAQDVAAVQKVTEKSYGLMYLLVVLIITLALLLVLGTPPREKEVRARV